MEKDTEKPKFFSSKNITVLVLCVLCFGIYLYSASRFLTFVSARESRLMHHNAFNPTNIQDWMTFAYINHVFKLPPNYLENSLHITDAEYPDISLRNYAEDHGVARNKFLVEVKGKVNDFQLLPQTSQSSQTQ